MIKLYADVRSVTSYDQCPSCGGAVRPDADWCTQCFTALGQGFDPLTAPLTEVLGQPDDAVMAQVAPSPPHVSSATESAAEQSQVPALTQATRSGRHARPVENDLGRPPVEEVPHQLQDISDVDVMLGILAAEHRSADRASAIAQHLGDRGTKTLFVLGGITVASTVFFILMFIVGLIL